MLIVSELPRVSKIRSSGRHLMEALNISSADAHIWNPLDMMRH